MSGLDTLPRLRARHALSKLVALSVRDAVGTFVKGLPVAIRTQGLATALASSAKEPAARELFRWLGDWYKERGFLAQAPANGAALLELLVLTGRREYVAMQSEAIAYFDQVKILSAGLKEPS